MRVYLGGPINGCTDEEAKGWREAVKPLLEERGHTWLDPMVRDYRGVEDTAYREIVEGDKADIDECGFLLMSCPKPSVGTSMEILYAWTENWDGPAGREIVAVLPPGAPVSPWLRYHATIYVGSEVDAVKDLLPPERTA